MDDKDEDIFSFIQGKSYNMSKKVSKADQEKKAKEHLLEVASARELNPHLNKSLPPPDKKSVSQKVDVRWLRKAFDRAKEQSNETGKSISEILSERYPMDQVSEMLRYFDKNNKDSRGHNYDTHDKRNKFSSPSSSSSEKKSKSCNFHTNRNEKHK